MPSGRCLVTLVHGTGEKGRQDHHLDERGMQLLRQRIGCRECVAPAQDNGWRSVPTCASRPTVLNGTLYSTISSFAVEAADCAYGSVSERTCWTTDLDRLSVVIWRPEVSATGEPFEVVGNSTVVEAWSTRRLGFEPKGRMLDYRGALRRAIQGLSASSSLAAVYSSPHRRFGDVENILFYNVGNVAFSKLGLRTLSFERAFESVRGKEHHYRYVGGEDSRRHWAHGSPVATWAAVPLSLPISTARTWAAIRAAPSVALHEATTAELVLDLEVSLPKPSLSIETMKETIDGVVAAFHHHVGDTGAELLRRLAVSLDTTVRDAERLLTSPHWDRLDRRALVHRWRDTLQWNPADDRLVAVKYALREGDPAVTGKLSIARSLTTPAS